MYSGVSTTLTRSRLSSNNLGRPGSAKQIPILYPLSAIWNKQESVVSVCVEKGLSKESSNVERLRKKGFDPRVASYGQLTALIPPEASPHKR